ncbi:MAG: triacylglycerol lipase [Sphingomonadales bacterium]|nr:triacylglycerol lipase [Sphingomonadales bacterium]MEA3049915.1 triacylglycerol lipase [Sphingomonadales bacterium]
MEPLDYDPSKMAVLTPEKSLKPLYKAGDEGWTTEAVCAELCRLAYLRFESDSGPTGGELLAHAIEMAGLADFDTLNESSRDAQAFVARGGGTAYVVYRGTQGDRWKDLLADFLFFPRPWKGPGWVHWGFWRAENILWPRVRDWLSRCGTDEVVVTGHSLGAAMATVTAARLPEARLVTFGSPRVGTRAFAAAFSADRVRRYVDCCDGVARVPPPWGFVHLPGERYIDRRGNVAAEPPGLVARLRDRTLGHLDYLRKCSLRNGNVLTRTLADHAPLNYISGALGVRRGP